MMIWKDTSNKVTKINDNTWSIRNYNFKNTNCIKYCYLKSFFNINQFFIIIGTLVKLFFISRLSFLIGFSYMERICHCFIRIWWHSKIVCCWSSTLVTCHAGLNVWDVLEALDILGAAYLIYWLFFRYMLASCS